MSTDFRTEHLSLDYLDRVWFEGFTGDEYHIRGLGTIDDDPRWPSELGAEPTWFVTEVDELRDQWEDAARFSLGCREAVDAAWTEAKGG